MLARRNSLELSQGGILLRGWGYPRDMHVLVLLEALLEFGYHSVQRVGQSHYVLGVLEFSQVHEGPVYQSL